MKAKYIQPGIVVRNNDARSYVICVSPNNDPQGGSGDSQPGDDIWSMGPGSSVPVVEE